MLNKSLSSSTNPDANSYDFHARWMTPANGIFTSPDPLCEKYYPISPYAYCAGNPISFVDPTGMDAILIVFPDYPIKIYKEKEIDIVGHAGVLLIDNSTGKTAYYEYGRYETADGTKGRVRMVSVPNATIGEDGKPTIQSLGNILNSLSQKAGKGGRINGAYVNSDKFTEMNNYAVQKYQESNNNNDSYNKNREEYSIFTNNCGTFAKDVINIDSNIKRPIIINTAPVNIVEEYQEEGYAQIKYDPIKNIITITQIKNNAEDE